jgi:hypothetical protein
VSKTEKNAHQAKPQAALLAAPSQAEQSDQASAHVLKKRQRARNYVLAIVLGAWVVLVYLISLVRLGGGS